MGAAVREFHQLHERRYGHSHPGEPTEIVTLRVRAIGRTPTPTFAPLAAGRRSPPADVYLGAAVVWFDKPLDTPLYARTKLLAGNVLSGPLVVLQLDATLLIPPGWVGQVDQAGNIIVQRTDVT